MFIDTLQLDHEQTYVNFSICKQTGARLVITEVLKDIKKRNRKSRLFILDTQADHKLKVVHEPETRISGFAIANIQTPNITGNINITTMIILQH